MTSCPGQSDHLLIAVGRMPKLTSMISAQFGVAGDVVGSEAPPRAFKCSQAVERPAVEQVPAGVLGDQPRNGAFAGAAGAVDGDDGLLPTLEGLNL